MSAPASMPGRHLRRLARRPRGRFLISFGTALLLLLGAYAPSTAQAAEIPAAVTAQQDINIVAAHTGKCLEVASSTVNEPVVQKRCSTTHRALWTLRTSPAGSGAIQIVNVFSGLCLEVADDSSLAGAAVRQGGCASRPGNTFKTVDVSSTVWIQSTTSSPPKCLEVTGSSTADAAPLRQWDCARQPGSEFIQQSVPVQATAIRNVNSGKCLSVDQSHLDGAHVVQRTCVQSLDQTWNVIAAENGRAILVNALTGKCLAVEDASTINGAGGVQMYCNGRLEQDWNIPLHASGARQLVNLNSGKYLGVRGESLVDGAETDQWSDSATQDQLWQLTLYTP